jgi:trypsin
MRKIAVAVVVALALAVPAGGARADQRIVGGGRASTADYPYVVYLTSPTGFQFCGGTLVSPRKVVTAAHCMVRRTAADIRVVAGRDDKESAAGAVAAVSKVWVHPDFTDVQRGSDVAVLTLSSLLAYRPARVAGPADARLYRAGTQSTILGWGRTAEGGQISRYLLAASVPVVADTDCAAAYRGFSANSMVCAGYPRGGVDSCQGDSGGPMMVGGVLVGIASWGEGCARPGEPGVYTRVSSYADLILAQL